MRCHPETTTALAAACRRQYGSRNNGSPLHHQSLGDRTGVNKGQE